MKLKKNETTRMGESWSLVPGFSGVEASTEGRIRKITGRAKRLKTEFGYLAPDGYRSVKIGNMPYRVHRLVALAFHANPNAFPMVNHKNGIKSDNRKQNVEWCSASHNCLHAFRIGLRVEPVGEDSDNSKLSERDVRSIFSAVLVNGDPVCAVARRFNISHTHVRNIVTRQNWKHLDYEQ